MTKDEEIHARKLGNLALLEIIMDLCNQCAGDIDGDGLCRTEHISSAENALSILHKNGLATTDDELIYQLHYDKLEEKKALLTTPFCQITGSEITFNMGVKESDIKEVAQNIWDHPSHFSEFADGSEASFYQFLKFLDIEFPDGHSERLIDFVIK